MACGNNEYNPTEHYTRVLGWKNIFPTKWKDKINEYFKPEIAAEIINLLENNRFDSSYGKRSLHEILCKRDSLTNTIDVGKLETTYTTSAGVRDRSDFIRMRNEFEENIISLLLIDKNTLKSIRTSEIIPSLKIDRANKNLYDFKMQLIQKLWSVLQPNKTLDTTYKGSDEFTKLIADTINLYNQKRLSDSKLDEPEIWNTYFQLRFFDELLINFGKGEFVKIKPEWASGRRKSNNMYEYIGPYVEYDTSYNPREMTTAEQYASKHLQILLDRFFKGVDSNNVDTATPIGFKTFNRAITSLIDWAESNSKIDYREELYKGVDDPESEYAGTNWSALIEAYINSKPPRDLYDALRGIKKLLDKDSPLDDQIKQLLQMQIARVVRYEFEVFRKKWDSGEHQNVIVPMRLKEAVVDLQKGSVAKRVRSRVYRSRRRPTSWDKFKNDFDIKVKDKVITFKGYTTSGSDLQLRLLSAKEKSNEFIFDWFVKDDDGNRVIFDGSFIDDEKIKKLVERLLQIPITSNYKYLLGTPEIVNKNLFDIFKPAIALAVSASEENFADFAFRLDGKELEIKGSNYADLEFPANFISIMNGVKNRTSLSNGLGNDLPVYQQRSAIFNAKRILDKGVHSFLSEHVESGIPDKYGIQRNNIYEDSILRNGTHGSPIGRTIVRVDYDYDNKNRVSAEMNFSELNYFSVLKSFYQRLINDGNIAIQTTCLSDKHTHFLVEFLTSKMNLKNGRNLREVLQRLARNVDSRSFNDSSLTDIEEEIKLRRASKTKVEMVNLLNRLEIILDLKSDNYNYSTVDMSFGELKKRINKINTLISATSADELNELAAKKEVTFFKEADVIELNEQTFINETLYNNFMMYCDESSNSKWLERIRREKMAYCKDMFNNNVKLDTLLDKSLLRVVRGLSGIPDFNKIWYDEKTGIIQSFIIKDKSGNVVTLSHSKNDIEKYFNSEEYIAVLNPVFDSYFYANALLSNAFNDIVFGEDYGLENKFIKNASGILKKLNKDKQELNNEIDELDESLKLQTGKNYKETEKKIREKWNQLNAISKEINDNSYSGKKFLQYSEASRLATHYKRTVHGGATYTPLVPQHYGVSEKVKVAIIDDVKAPAFSITGNDSKGFTSQDGAGWASPYWSRMCNKSYVDGAVGKNKKTIFSYVDPETGVLTLIKWAEYEITNSLRRDSPLDNDHSSYEYAFKKMHNFTLDPSIFNDFDISDYYNLDDITCKELYVFDPETGTHRLIKNLQNDGNKFTWETVIVDENGKELSQSVDNEKYVNSIYDLDQIFGGAWVEEIQSDGRLDFSEAQNDIIHKIICDLNIKDKFIGWAINASAVKSGMRNNNSSNSFVTSNKNALRYFEISTANGGAQMNADHVIGETEVTEMSQMISALVQNGLQINKVNEIYKFIGQVASESLGDIVKWQDDEDKNAEIYKWLGEALAYSFSMESDTMGLTTAFIAKANNNLEREGLLTRIPFSAPSVRGKFEATITSFINSNAIRRKYPGGGYVQNPTFDARLRYNLNGVSYNYSEFLNAINEYNKNRNLTKVTAQTALNDSSWDSVRKRFNNPFIEILSPIDVSAFDPAIVIGKRSVSTLDIDDTIIAFNLDENNNIINEEIVRLDDFYKWDKYRNLVKDKYIAHWTVKPKNLLGSRIFFDVNGRQHSLYDLDSVRALMYAQMEPKDIKGGYKIFLDKYILNNQIDLNVSPDWDGTIDKKLQNDVIKFARWKIHQDLKKLSKIQESKFGEFESQDAFGIVGNVTISNFKFAASQVLMGLGAKREFGIKNRSDLISVQKDPKQFFNSQLQYLASKPLRKSVDPSMYDAVLHGSNGTTALLIVDNIHGSLPAGLVPDIEYKKDDNNHVWYQGEDLGYAKGLNFYRYAGKDGEMYTVIKADNFESFDNFNNESKLYTTFLPNANQENWKRLANYTPGIIKREGKYFAFINDREREISNSELLNYLIGKKVYSEISKLADKKTASWRAYKKGIGTRIPAQSMQSFTECELIDFTNDEDTSVYISTTLAWLMGSDFDIDKLYYMTYGFTEDGMLATFSNLDTILDPEDCLSLPKPKNRKLSVYFYDNDDDFYDQLRIMNPSNYKKISMQGDGIKLLKECLSDDVTNDTILFVHSSDMNQVVWEPYVQDHAKSKNYSKVFQSWLKTHERSRRSNSIKQIALRNVVVKGILDILHDSSTQYNLQVPISMDEQRDAAKLSTMAAEERYLTSDQPGSTFKMTVQNMIGREVIGIGASSLKAFFGATTYFNTIVNTIQKQYEEHEEGGNIYKRWKSDQEVWNLLKNLVFNSKFGNRNKGLITFANINFDELITFLKDNPTLQIITLNDLQLTSVNDNIIAKNKETFVHDFLSKDAFGRYQINVLSFIENLNKAANGEWDSPIDAAYSLSGLISAATDNAKELILAKINATTKFADIYTYLLSIGEHFEDIAEFMISDEFNVVARYAESNIIDPNTSWFDLEHSIKFVLNEETLPIVDNKIFNWILTSINQGYGVLDQIFDQPDLSFLNKLNDYLGKQVWDGGNFESFKTRIVNIIRNNRKEDDPTQYTDDYKNLVQWVYSVINDNPKYLINFLRWKVGDPKSEQSDNTQNYQPEPEYSEDILYDMEDAHQEEDMARSYSFNGKLDRDEWRRYLQYVTQYLIPKNDTLRGINDLSKLHELRNNILPALKELRMLSHLLGINKGLETNDFNEYKWIRDIETFVNQRYFDGKTNVESFDMMKFIKDEAYRDKQIKQYEDVKSTYNILDIISKSGHFWEMIKTSRTNRIYIEKAVASRYTRTLANKILLVDKKITNGISKGETQKLNESEYKILQSTVRDLISYNWVSTLAGIKINIPLRRVNNAYFKNGSIHWVKNNEINIWDSKGRPLTDDRKLIDDEITSREIDINDADGLATLKWLVENYIIDELQNHPDFQDNSFIQGLLNDYKKTKDDEVIEFVSMPIGLSNPDHNFELEQVIDNYRTAFDKIYNKKVPKEIGIGDWTIGDLFFVYNLYVHNEIAGGNSLTRLFDHMVASDDSSLLITNYYDYLCKLDSGVDTIPELEQIENLSASDKVSLSNNKLLKDVRQQFADTVSAASKFRVRKTDTDFEFLDEKYQSTGLSWPISKVDRSFYLYNFALYNPVKLIENPSLEKVLSAKQQAISRNVNAKDAVEIVVSYLQKTFNGVIPITTVNDAWITKNAHKLNQYAKDSLGFILNGKIYINTDKATVSTPIHELMHVIFAVLKFGDDDQRKMYYDLLNLVKERKQQNDPVWTKYWNDIEKVYSGYAIGSDLKEEVLIKYMEDIFTNAYLKGLTIKTNLTVNSNIEATYLKFEQRIIDAINKAFATYLPKDTTAKDVLNQSLGELLVSASSDLMNFNSEDISATYLPNSQKIAKFKRIMAETGNLIFNGDC